MTTHQTPLERHPIRRAAAEVTAAVKSVAGLDAVFMTLADKQAALVELAQARDLLESLWLRQLAGSADVAEQDGCRDIAAWLATHARIDRPTAAAQLRTATALATRWRQVETALADSSVNTGQARVIVKALETLDEALRADETVLNREELLARAEAKLIELADLHGPRDLARLAESILTIVAPLVAEEAERRALEAAERRAAATTRLTLRRRGDGSVDLHARIPELAAARLKTYLDAYTSPRRDSLTNGLTDPATGERLPAERLNGDAFVALLEAIDPTRLPQYGGKATTVVVTITEEQLRTGLGVATTSDGTLISVDQLRRLACQAGIIPAVMGGKSRVLDLGRRRRFHTKAQRLALVISIATCQAEGCTVPAAWCEVHHHVPWSRGGRTDLDDARLYCSHHHHRAHDPAYTTTQTPDGRTRFHRRT
ncbi:HNH endonuclease signature motif containing protein [Nocardioides gansuensis]|nr:HNH endonuclease signature motif containing protein [Nocardioides gansuensis]